MTIASWLVATKVAGCPFLIALAALANVFNICWFIVGSIDVFGNWSSYNLPNSDDANEAGSFSSAKIVISQYSYHTNALI